MQILIRRIRRDRKGLEELFEDSHDGASITIGHRNDQRLQLLDPDIAPRHALVTAARGGAFDVRTMGAATVRLAGKAVSRARLLPGQSVEIGRQTLTVVQAPPGFDAALEVVELAPDDDYGPATHFVVDLSRTRLRNRPWAWAALLLIPLLFLALPLLGRQDPVVGQWLRDHTPFPTDASWSSGALSNAHHSPEVGSDCTVCHVKAFEPTPDRACLTCHERVNEHYEQERIGTQLLGGQRCASCHTEHNQPGNLLRRDNGMCIDCHRDLADRIPGSDPAGLSLPVHGFSAGAHPEFQLALLKFDDAAWGFSARSARRDETPPPQETSNLRFPHDLHMDPKRVKVAGTEEAPRCVACHEAGTDREHFVPITMERHCRSCHSLAFDEDEPTRQLPHADVPAAVMALEEHFIRRFVDPRLRADPAAGSGRRRLGQAPQADPCVGDPLRCARERAELEAQSQFSRSGCVTCHEVTEDASKPLAQRWRVKPVRLVRDWYPNARFDHYVHLTPGVGGDEGDKACQKCHASNVSDKSADILIPPIKTCLECHGDQNALGTVKLDCGSCHGFHQAAGSPLDTLHADFGARDAARK